MGRYAAIINSVRTTNFGTNFDWTTNEPKHNTWAEYLDREWDVERRIIDNTRALPIEPSLNHGDMRFKNVIVDEDGQICSDC